MINILRNIQFIIDYNVILFEINIESLLIYFIYTLSIKSIIIKLFFAILIKKNIKIASSKSVF